MIKEAFLNILRGYSVSKKQQEDFWIEIEQNYSNPNRHYHNLNHINKLYSILLNYKRRIEDFDTILLSVIYHDIVYEVSSNSNEEQSAELAIERLSFIGYPSPKISRCSEQILATKGHQVSVDNDTNLFTDADLFILGTDWKIYSTYTNQIRLEYSIYPDDIYIPGRMKVLNHFLQMDRIFKTDEFHRRFENQARENLVNELAQLKNFYI